jgi:hypothetical protein
MTRAESGFTVLEALVTSALLAFGLAGAMRLSVTSMAAMQLSRHVDVASGLAQDLAECWHVQTPSCLTLFQHSGAVFPLSTDPGLGFERTWTIHNIPIPNMPPQHLQEIRITVAWQEAGQSTQIDWLARQASTPPWVGL